MGHRAVFAKLVAFAGVLALALGIALGCKAKPAPAAAGPYPTSVAQAGVLKKGGASWTNEQIRVYYNQVVDTIGPADEGWKRDGIGAEERARRAFAIRRDARLTTRAMMSDPHEVDDLRRRDQEKYGNPDGPTFDQLVASGAQKGATGDALYEGIVKSAQHTDAKVNAFFGIEKKP
jgi:hypothetical protein